MLIKSHILGLSIIFFNANEFDKLKGFFIFWEKYCFKTISNGIDSSWLTSTKETFKQNCKKEFITAPFQLY